MTVKIVQWTGPLLRLAPQSPARRSLAEAVKPAMRKPGKRLLNWIKQVINDLRDIKFIETQKSLFSKLENAAIYRVAFRKKVHS